MVIARSTPHHLNKFISSSDNLSSATAPHATFICISRMPIMRGQLTVMLRSLREDSVLKYGHQRSSMGQSSMQQYSKAMGMWRSSSRGLVLVQQELG